MPSQPIAFFYSNSFALSNASELFLSRIPKNHIQVQKEKKPKKCTKKRDELLFCLVNLLLFFLRSGWRRRRRRRRGILKVPNIRGLSPTFKPVFQQVSWVNTEF